MKKYISLAALCLFFCISHAQTPDTKATEPSVEGRWDITISTDGKEFPSWLEVSHSGVSTLVGRFVGMGGSARPISKVNFSDGKMTFTIPPQWERGTTDLSFEATLQGNKLTGTMVMPDAKVLNWTARRAPLLKGTYTPVWDKPIQLLKGNSIEGWHALGNNQWVVQNGVLKSPHSGANLVTDQKFGDFKLHVEFRCPKGSNSGVYLRGRYEVQIEDDFGKEPDSHLLGGIYGFLTPNEMAAKQADEWQTYDITLVGRLVTVVVNGREVITRQAIPGITGGALDSHEEETGPIYLQGDHGPIEYRNIIITPAKVQAMQGVRDDN